MNLTLPHPPDREALLGFWVGVAVCVGTALGALLVVSEELTAVVSLAAAVVLGVGLVLVPLLRRHIVTDVYQLWNRAARAYGRKASEAIAVIWYWTVFVAVAGTGEKGSINLGNSLWGDRITLPASAYGYLGDVPTGRDGSGGFRGFVRWAIGSERYWTLMLLPLLWLLRVLDTRNGHPEISSDIYTLY